MSEGGKEAVRVDDDVVAASEVRRLEECVRKVQRLLDRKTLQVEILKEASTWRGPKNRPCCRARRRQTLPSEDHRCHAWRCPIEPRRAQGWRSAKVWAAVPGGRYRACRRHQAPGSCAACVEKRLRKVPAPHRVQWLSPNDIAFAPRP
jgi:hypothetical protein